jgi:mono/diheme cytochrome c family protein
MNRKTAFMALVTIAALLVVTAVAGAQAKKGEEGAALYKKMCAMCHGAAGAGDTAMGKKMNIRDLKSEDVQKQTDAQLEEIIAKGKGKMPGYGSKLQPAQAKDLVAYIRTLKK